MKNKRIGLLLVSLIFLSIFISGFAAAQTTPDEAEAARQTLQGVTLEKTFGWLPDFLETPLISLIRVWQIGDAGATGYLIKYLVLILIITLIYTVLTQVGFPGKKDKTSVSRLILSIIIGFLATLFISQEELIALMVSYTALGTAIILFFPIAILIFFTIVVSAKGSPMGIFMQKILWIIYSVFLFIKSMFGLWANWVVKNSSYGAGTVLSNGEINNSLITFFVGNSTQATTTITQGTGGANIILLIMLIVSIAIFIITIWKGNDIVVAWLAEQDRKADAEKQKDTIQRSQDYDKARAAATRS